MFRDSLRELLSRELPPERIRALWDSDTGRDPELWQKFAQMGLLGMMATEQDGGLGLDEIDFVLLAEVCGQAALPEPLVDTVLVAVPLLEALGDPQLAAVIAGEQRVALGNPLDPFVADAHVAERWILPGAEGGEVHIAAADPALLTHQPSLDPSRRLFGIAGGTAAADCCADGERARLLWGQACRRGALGAAAQQLGLAERMLDMAVQYTSERQQFGVPVGSFQAVKHLLADVRLRLDFARPLVYRAAWESARGTDKAAELAVAQGFLAASEAALLAARNCMQVHGAMGYTWELDLQIWMKRVWVLDKLWGGRSRCKRLLDRYLTDPAAALGAGSTFFAPPTEQEMAHG